MKGCPLCELKEVWEKLSSMEKDFSMFLEKKEMQNDYEGWRVDGAFHLVTTGILILGELLNDFTERTGLWRESFDSDHVNA